MTAPDLAALREKALAAAEADPEERRSGGPWTATERVRFRAGFDDAAAMVEEARAEHQRFVLEHSFDAFQRLRAERDTAQAALGATEALLRRLWTAFSQADGNTRVIRGYGLMDIQDPLAVELRARFPSL